MTWDAVTNTLLVNDIGLHSWEEINIITKGGNYGWAEREGNENREYRARATRRGTNWIRGSLSRIRMCWTVTGIDKPVAPIYPVAIVQPHGRRCHGQRICVPRQADAADGRKIFVHRYQYGPNVLHGPGGDDRIRESPRKTSGHSRNSDHVQQPVRCVPKSTGKTAHV